MKVKELIKELEQCSPDAEVICWRDGPLYSIDEVPGYYDGSTDYLILDEDCDCYNVIGYGYDKSRDKVRLWGHDLKDCLYDLEPNQIDKFPVKFATSYERNGYKEIVKKLKKEVKANLLKWEKERKNK